ncbi:IS30 family transposase [Bifidobacterium vespertilionis]|uniref:IS30 family transposase n=3 Tax=Bifidobacterium vespertilionis TaxID=2562524 RepID=A0ABQ6STF8_9BIFI|nr:IS30 family transposase [Bifidobacterium vespertilionis]KAA8821177.1 IS30 family transposase [Bifidobacterium vespertilionis]
MKKVYSHLSAEERVRIDELRNRDGLGVNEIARRIGRDKSTISRELRRGLWFASNENDSYRPYRPKRLKTGAWTARPFYSAMTAQRKAETRARRSRKPLRMAYDPLLSWVMDALRKGWTPERIEGRLKVQFPDDPRMRVSHECLYRWIYAKPQQTLDLRQYLPRGKRRRTRAKGRGSKGPRIPMRVPIADRPKRVDSRHEFGHFESDTVIGTAPSKRCIDTQVERKSRKLFARFIPDKSALATARAEYDIYSRIPAPARIDRTWDNGTESSCHLLVDEALGMPAYYADPYSSYQRGTNENRNGRIRRYLPKRTSFDDMSDEDLQAIVQEINDTPLKVLGWETPNEVWYRELGKVMSKTSHPKTSVALTN